MLGIQKISSGKIIPCVHCGKLLRKCPCIYRCPHPKHPKDKNGNPYLRNNCQGCWDVYPYSDRVWNEALLCFVAPNDPSLVQTFNSGAHLQLHELPDSEYWAIMDVVMNADAGAGADAGADPVSDDNSEIIWDYVDEIRRREEQEAQQQMSPEEVERIEALFNEPASDDE